MKKIKRVSVNSLNSISDECTAKNNLLECNIYFDEFNQANNRLNKSENKGNFDNDGFCLWND